MLETLGCLLLTMSTDMPTFASNYCCFPLHHRFQSVNKLFLLSCWCAEACRSSRCWRINWENPSRMREKYAFTKSSPSSWKYNENSGNSFPWKKQNEAACDWWKMEQMKEEEGKILSSHLHELLIFYPSLSSCPSYSWLRAFLKFSRLESDSNFLLMLKANHAFYFVSLRNPESQAQEWENFSSLLPLVVF